MISADTIRSYLVENSSWVNPEHTVDTVKIGDPDRPVKKAGVCWYAALDTIKAAHAAGCDLLICHEPTFWQHEAPEDLLRNEEPGTTKRQFLEQTGMVILRAHDTWDQWPEIGIRDSWADFLGLTECVYASEGHNFHGVYAITPQSLRQFAQHVADCVQPLGEDSVQIMGDAERIVSRPALGVGCIGPDKKCIQEGADVILVCYDGAPYWAIREQFYEMGATIITVEHGSSEMPGLENLCRHLRVQFPDIPFEFFAEHPRTWTVKGRG